MRGRHGEAEEGQQHRNVLALGFSGRDEQALQKGLGRGDDATDTALLQFLVQQQWASAYEKNQTGQNTMVIQNTQGNSTVALPAPALTGAVDGE